MRKIFSGIPLDQVETSVQWDLSLLILLNQFFFEVGKETNISEEIDAPSLLNRGFNPVQ